MTSSQSGHLQLAPPALAAHPVDPTQPAAGQDHFLLSQNFGFRLLVPFDRVDQMSGANGRRAVIDLTGDDAGPSSRPNIRTSTRRPVASNSTNNASTSSNNHTATASTSTRATRPPNFERDIIDVDALPDQPERRAAQLRPPSPEVEVTHSRPVNPSTRRRRSIPPARQPDPDGLGGAMAFFRHPLVPLDTGGFGPGGSTGHAGSAATGQSGTAGSQRRRDQTTLRFGTRLLERIEQDAVTRGSSLADVRRRQELIVAENRARFGQPPLAAFNAASLYGAPQGPDLVLAGGNALDSFDVPQLAYEMVALRERPLAHPTPLEMPPTPSPARAGFTRAPEERHVIVCPNCDDELGTGETDEKRSVWFVRGCGHVYCGECVKNRSVVRKRGVQRTAKGEPFKSCKVCDRPVSARTAFRQVFV